MVIMKVNGTEITLKGGGGVSEIIHTLVSGGPPPDTSRAVFLAGFRNGADSLFRVRIGTLAYTGGIPSTTEIEGFLTPGARTLAEPAGGAQGVVLEWLDASGVRYGTSCGTATGPSRSARSQRSRSGSSTT
ncbi:MAG: hypothetical protein JNM31_14325 [Flavobacteriales bacterium]|nr:hypothetical protein [Flavobacteriales bacterium]